MKLILSIVSNQDVENVMNALSRAGFMATKVSTVGQFLKDGNSALLVGTDDNLVEQVYDVLRNNVSERKIKNKGVTSTINGSLLKQAIDVEENGAVAFTINVEDFKKF